MISFIATLGGFLFGFDTAVVSGALEHLRPQYQLDKFMEGVLVASALVGCMVGAFFAGSLSDRFGRKATLIVSAVLFLVGFVGTAVPPTVTLLILRPLDRWCGCGDRVDARADVLVGGESTALAGSPDRAVSAGHHDRHRRGLLLELLSAVALDARVGRHVRGALAVDAGG